MTEGVGSEAFLKTQEMAIDVTPTNGGHILPIANGRRHLPSKKPFPGNTRILFNGMIVTAEKNALLWVTLTLLFLLYGLFAVLVAPDIVKFLSVWPLVVTCVLFVLVVLSCFATAWRDPGILPRGLHPRSTLRMIGATDYGVDGTISRLVFHEQNPDFLFGKEIIVNDQKVFLKYCGTCELFRPPRCSHCSFCDNCVEEFDHHCPWLSNCIGKRNYRFFLLFIILVSVLCITVAVEVGVTFSRATHYHTMDFADGLLKYWYLVTLFVITCLVGLMLTLLSLYHCFLVANSMTTSEQVKLSRAGVKRSPEEETTSCPQSVYRTLCSPIPKSTIDWSQYSTKKRIPTSKDSDCNYV